MRRQTQTIITLVTLALCAENVLAAAIYPDFTVNELPAAGLENTFSADKITGNYSETAKFEATDPMNGIFSLSAIFDVQGFSTNNGSAAVSGLYLNGFEPNAYKMYALMTVMGSYTISSFGVNGPNAHFNPFIGSLALLIDKDSNTTFIDPKDGISPILADVASAIDDELLGFGDTDVNGDGNISPDNISCQVGNNCGNFGVNMDFALTDFGKTYFATPDPFYNIIMTSGVVNNFDLTDVQEINGVMNMTFANTPDEPNPPQLLPEPTDLSLIGIGLIMLGLHRHKQVI